MRKFLRQLQETPCCDLFHSIRDKAKENGITIYAVEFTLNKLGLMFAKENEYLVLCIAFADKKEDRLVDEKGYALGKDDKYFCPITHVKYMRDKLEEVCLHNKVNPIIYMGVFMEYGILNPKTDSERWKTEGFSLVFDRVPMEVEIEGTAYSKALRISEFIHAK